MRRNARSYDDKEDGSSLFYSVQPTHGSESFLKMERLHNTITPRLDNIIEAKVEPDDTLQAMALRFHCTVADIKRLNKIDKDNEIHARKVLKIPITIHNVLLDNLPMVHTSGNNSPKFIKLSDNDNPTHSTESRESISGLSSLIRNPLENNEAVLSEKLIVASVNSSTLNGNVGNATESGREETNSINSVILNSKLKSTIYTDEDLQSTSVDFGDNDDTTPLTTILDNSTNIPKMHRIRGPPLRTINWSGSDCDMSWMCLFVIIMALCFVIPLVYVFYIAEHIHHNNSSTSVGSVQVNH